MCDCRDRFFIFSECQEKSRGLFILLKLGKFVGRDFLLQFGACFMRLLNLTVPDENWLENVFLFTKFCNIGLQSNF